MNQDVLIKQIVEEETEYADRNKKPQELKIEFK